MQYARSATNVDEFDFIAVQGTSGIVVGAPVAVALGKPLIVVRKDNDGSHSHRKVIGRPDGRMCFLDDKVATGTTRCRVRDAVLAVSPEVVFSCLYLYHRDDYRALDNA